MPESVVVALITGGLASIPATIAALAALRQARGAHREVKGNGTGVPASEQLAVIRQTVELTNDRISDHLRMDHGNN